MSTDTDLEVGEGHSSNEQNKFSEDIITLSDSCVQVNVNNTITVS